MGYLITGCLEPWKPSDFAGEVAVAGLFALQGKCSIAFYHSNAIDGQGPPERGLLLASRAMLRLKEGKI